MPKIQHFVWRLLSKALAIKSTLNQRHIPVDPFCARCCTIEETPIHLFFNCPFAQEGWRLLGIPMTPIVDHTISLEDKIRHIFQIHRDEQLDRATRCTPIWTLWRLWKCRNQLQYNQTNIQIY